MQTQTDWNTGISYPYGVIPIWEKKSFSGVRPYNVRSVRNRDWRAENTLRKAKTVWRAPHGWVKCCRLGLTLSGSHISLSDPSASARSCRLMLCCSSVCSANIYEAPPEVCKCFPFRGKCWGSWRLLPSLWFNEEVHGENLKGRAQVILWTSLKGSQTASAGEPLCLCILNIAWTTVMRRQDRKAGKKITWEELQWVHFLSSVVQNSFLQQPSCSLGSLNCWAKVYPFPWSNLEATPGREAAWHPWQLWQSLWYQQVLSKWRGCVTSVPPWITSIWNVKKKKKKYSWDWSVASMKTLKGERDCSSFFSASR